MPHSDPTVYLRHIITEIEYLTVAVRDLRYEQYVADDNLRRAFVRSLEVIGEAARNYRAGTAPVGEVDWKGLTGMRNKLIHEYFGVDHRIVWETVAVRIPELRQQIEKLLS